MIYTASFFEPQHFGPGRLVSIALKNPGIDLGPRTAELVTNELLQPTWNMVNSFQAGVMDVNEYTLQYGRNLKKRLACWDDFRHGRLGESALEKLGLRDNDTLLCWEHYPQFCHRYIVAKLLRRNGIQVVRN